MALSGYVFNVSRKGKHIFRTDVDSGHFMDAEKAQDAFNELTKRYPESDGYEIAARFEFSVSRDFTADFIVARDAGAVHEHPFNQHGFSGDEDRKEQPS